MCSFSGFQNYQGNNFFAEQKQAVCDLPATNRTASSSQGNISFGCYSFDINFELQARDNPELWGVPMPVTQLTSHCPHVSRKGKKLPLAHLKNPSLEMNVYTN